MSGTEGAHAAQQMRRMRLQQEEEELNHHTEGIMSENWEYKIVRSTTKAFKKPRNMAKALEGESLGGWDLFEKLDDGRLRMRRPSSERREDNLRPSGYDPYRIQYGMSEEGLAAAVIGGIVALAALGFGIAYFLGQVP